MSDWKYKLHENAIGPAVVPRGPIPAPERVRKGPFGCRHLLETPSKQTSTESLTPNLPILPPLVWKSNGSLSVAVGIWFMLDACWPAKSNPLLPLHEQK